ncbi:MAG: hypothetical protein KA184_10190 [Candidatus Hydrogenedentes bacterium]|nr:hypothetical protein [Candidatus Hydrogenedentota bacterium]
MRCRIYVLALAMLALLFATVGCVPAEAPRTAPPAAPPVPEPAAAQPEQATVAPAPEPQAEDTAIVPAPAQSPPPPGEAQQNQQSLAFLSPEQMARADVATVTLSRIDDELLYSVSGSYGLTGTIAKASPEDVEWVFKGQLTFPSGGYKLGPLHSNAVLGSQANVLLFIPVTLPAADAATTQALETVSFEYRFPAENNTQILVQFSSS